jgi:hypothetical protein
LASAVTRLRAAPMTLFAPLNHMLMNGFFSARDYASAVVVITIGRVAVSGAFVEEGCASECRGRSIVKTHPDQVGRGR